MPTASYCLDPKSPRPMGEQRRRARYDAKKKAALLAQSLSAEEFSLLELGLSLFFYFLLSFFFNLFILDFDFRYFFFMYFAFSSNE